MDPSLRWDDGFFAIPDYQKGPFLGALVASGIPPTSPA